MNSLVFSLVYQEAQRYSSWLKYQTKLSQSNEDKTERENIEALKSAKDFYSSLMKGVA